jgi:hypothetical protein
VRLLPSQWKELEQRRQTYIVRLVIFTTIEIHVLVSCVMTDEGCMILKKLVPYHITTRFHNQKTAHCQKFTFIYEIYCLRKTIRIAQENEIGLELNGETSYWTMPMYSFVGR